MTRYVYRPPETWNDVPTWGLVLLELLSLFLTFETGRGRAWILFVPMALMCLYLTIQCVQRVVRRIVGSNRRNR